MLSMFLLGIPLVLLLWFICGMFNVAVETARGIYEMSNGNYLDRRDKMILISMGPFLAGWNLGRGLLHFPFMLSARYGSQLGRWYANKFD